MAAKLISVNPAENYGERKVLQILRDQLPSSFQILANFYLHRNGRPFECDAAVFADAGWAYLVETKQWVGKITGNDNEWALPAMVGEGVAYRPNPVPIVRRKAQMLRELLQSVAPQLGAMRIQHVVVLVSEDQPVLTGEFAKDVVLLGDLVARVMTDPRRPGDRGSLPADVATRAAEIVSRESLPIAPLNVLGPYKLEDMVEAGPLWEVWSARPRDAPDLPQVRLKRYRLDSLATADLAVQQKERATRELSALTRLGGVPGVVPIMFTQEIDSSSFIVVTQWPLGESLASLLAENRIGREDIKDVALGLIHAVAGVHSADVIHRNLSLRCAHWSPDGLVQLTDFDYAHLPDKTGAVTEAIGEELKSPDMAPEVRREPSSASKASDVYTLVRLVVKLFGALSEDDRYDWSRIPAVWRQPLTAALSEKPEERPSDARELLQSMSPGPIPPDLQVYQFLTNDVIDDRYVVLAEPMSKGGICLVYQVYDSLVQREFAAKFVRAEFEDQVDPVTEFQLLRAIPPHEAIIAPLNVVAMRTLRRGTAEYRLNKKFSLCEWVEGDTLDRLLYERISPPRCVEIVLDVAAAVSHLHHYGLLHRDVKPHNIIVNKKSGRPQLFDFNVSTLADAATMTSVGTAFYRPPEKPLIWGPHCDIYGLAVVLCELLAARFLGTGCQEWLGRQTLESPTLLKVLTKATSADPTERFESVKDFAGDLRQALVELNSDRLVDSPAPFPAVPEEELARENWNAYQFRLLQLFSQSSVTNAKTRGLDDFSRWTYVPTRLDEKLRPHLMAGNHRLVIITGNAGDGKTAFIQMLEDRLRAGGAIDKGEPLGNGASLRLGQLSFLTNWDGSQDEGNVDNDAVLLKFFLPYVGGNPEPSEEVRIIAINEGRLIDFFTKHALDFKWLEAEVSRVMVEQKEPDADWLLFVNLNLRALTLSSTEGPSLVDDLINRMVDRRLWEPCERCRVAEHCYARANADFLRHPVLGPTGRERIRQTMDIVRLRRRLHITMRDLRSALAYVIAGNRTCDEIVAMVDSSDRRGLLLGHAYNALFAASDKLPVGDRPLEASQDRLLRLLGEIDVAKTAQPEEDADLWLTGIDALRPEPDGLSRSDRTIIKEVIDRLPASGRQLLQGSGREDLILAMSSLRRKRFVEREDPGWTDMLPFKERMHGYTALLASDHLEAGAIVRAISNSEGLYHLGFSHNLAVRMVADGDVEFRTYAMRGSQEFLLEPLDHSRLAKFVEYRPDSLRLRHLQHKDVWLDIDLDLYETLMRISEGFTPSREDLRGTWLNLRVFKERLASLPMESLLLSKDDREFYRISREAHDRRIVAQKVDEWR